MDTNLIVMNVVKGRCKVSLIAFLIFFGHVQVQGATKYWVGTTSDWNTPANWSDGLVPANGDILNIGVNSGDVYINSPVISSTPTGTPAAINIGSLVANTITINNGATLKAANIFMSSTTLRNRLNVNGTLDVDAISMSGTLLTNNQIVLGASSTLDLSGAINGGGTLVPSAAATAKIVLDGTAGVQSFGTSSVSISGDIGVLDIENTFNSSSTSRGVTFTGGIVDHLIVGANAIFNANASLSEGTGYYATVGANAHYISKSNFNFHANDNVDATATLEFTSASQTINLYKANTNNMNTCPNVSFTGTTVSINGGPATYSASNSNNNPAFLVRGNLDIASSTSTVNYTGINLIDINGNFSGGGALLPGNLPINIAGSWFNTASDNLLGSVTYDGNTGGTMQSVSTGVNYKNNLVFTGATVKRIATGTLKVGATLDNSAGSTVDFVTKATTTLMNGSTAQVIKGGNSLNNTYSTDVVNGTLFYNLTVATNGATTVNKTTTLSGYCNIAPTGVLSLVTSGGVLDASANNSLTLMSTANGSACVADLTNNGTTTGTNMPVINGTVYVQRFITGGTATIGSSYVYRGYRLLSSPVNITSAAASTSASSPNYISINYLKGYTANSVTYPGAFVAGAGGTAGGFSAYNANPTIYLYNEKMVPSNANFTAGKNWGVTNINTNNSVKLSDNNTYNIPVGNGFLMYFVGSSARTSGSASIAPDNAMRTAPGYLNQGTINLNLWYTPANGSPGQLSFNMPALPWASAGYNMVGNPYASTLNLSKLMADNPGIDAIFLLNNQNPAQAYMAYTANGTSAPSSGYVVSGEGFMVHTTGAAQTLTFKETQKATMQLTGSALILAEARPGGQPLTGLYVKMEQDSMVYDYCGIYFRNDWSDKFEAGDAMDLDGATPNVYMSSFTADGMRVAVNHVADYRQRVSHIRLYTDAKVSGLYHLKLEGIRNIDTLYNIYLLDHYKKDSLDIRHYGSYAFNILKNDTASFGGNRFELVIQRRPLPAYQLRSFMGQKAEGSIKVIWCTNNEGTYTGFELEKLDNSTNQYQPIYSRQSNGSCSYSYTDTNPLLTGVNTYRLKQNDVNGNITYSDAITVTYNTLNNAVSLYPNPARENIKMTVSTTDNSVQSYTTNIYNNTGVVVAHGAASTNSWSVEIGNLSPGAYTAEVKNSKGEIAGKVKFIKVQ